jgi:hypothetical protein
MGLVQCCVTCSWESLGPGDPMGALDSGTRGQAEVTWRRCKSVPVMLIPSSPALVCLRVTMLLWLCKAHCHHGVRTPRSDC